jgi:extradiol dioxygenase family protein
MFHLAFPVKDLQETKDFYINILGAKLGRSSSNWVDFNLRWNQITVHQNAKFEKLTPHFGSKGVPINHFGIIQVLPEWKKTLKDLEEKKISFLVEPTIVFEGQPGEQHSFFIEDPNGYAIEFKGFHDFSHVFKTTFEE